MGRTAGVWCLFLAACLLPVSIRQGIPFSFVGRGLLSSVLSFGGGDAFLSVAEGMFVESGMIAESVFYDQVVTVVNILPGSILCKTLSGIGYLTGCEAFGGVPGGILMALAGFGISVFGSCTVFMACYQIYSELENLVLFQTIGKYIKPIISGLLISIVLSLLTKIGGSGQAGGIPAYVMYGNSILIFLVIVLMGRAEKKFGLMILTAAVLSGILCNLGI